MISHWILCFFPYFFFRQVNNLGFPLQLRGKCYPFVSPGPVWGKRITEAGAHQKRVPNKKRSRSWGGTSSESHASSISTIYTYLTYLTTPPWSPRYYRYHVTSLDVSRCFFRGPQGDLCHQARGWWITQKA